MNGRSFRLLLGALACGVLACSSDHVSGASTDAASHAPASSDAGASTDRADARANVAVGDSSDLGTTRPDGGHESGSDAATGPVSTTPPAACPASDRGNVADGKDTFVANTNKTAVSSLTYSNVGASGAYAQVVDGWSKATGCKADPDGNLCKTVYRKPKQVSGSLAPFDEEMTPVFGGPIELYQLAVYSPSAGAWTRRAYWDRCVSDGLVFAGNKSWYECNGFVESYVSADGTLKSDAPVQFSGSIAAGTEVNVMSSALCSGSGADSDCGWSSGLALHGFQGDADGSKIIAVKLRMPIGDKAPAYWILPSQVIRSSQYGCNCRGQGSDPTYKGGCGELDVAEILGGVTTSLEATSTLYSFQDITGGGSVAFDRPVHEAATFVVIFDAPSRQIAIRRLAASEFDFAASVSTQRVSDWLADQGTLRALK